MTQLQLTQFSSWYSRGIDDKKKKQERLLRGIIYPRHLLKPKNVQKQVIPQVDERLSNKKQKMSLLGKTLIVKMERMMKLDKYLKGGNKDRLYKLIGIMCLIGSAYIYLNWDSTYEVDMAEQSVDDENENKNGIRVQLRAAGLEKVRRYHFTRKLEHSYTIDLVSF